MMVHGKYKAKQRAPDGANKTTRGYFMNIFIVTQAAAEKGKFKSLEVNV